MLIFTRSESEANKCVVNGILLHHNIEKQMSDSRGEVAYLMADISAVKEGEIRDLFQSLEELSRMYTRKLWIWGEC
jgi:2-phospho-L-lactate guanylyltransferase (CobY/MobA/RfbA family)